MRDTKKTLAEILADFEVTGVPNQIVLDDVWFWPLLRASIVGQVMSEVPIQSNCSPVSGPFVAGVRRFNAYLKILGSATGAIGSRAFGRPWLWHGANGIALTRTSRWKIHNGNLVDTILEPIVEALVSRGVSFRYWSWDASKSTKCGGRPVLGLEKRLADSVAQARLSRRLRGRRREPPWFRDVYKYCIEYLGIEHSWARVESQFFQIQAMRRYFERLWNRSGADFLLSDCWYDWGTAACILAAKSSSARVLEVQHGIQEYGHPCYHGWCAVAPSDYLNPYPVEHWVWGERNRVLFSEHSLVERVYVGGHEFQRRFIESADARQSCQRNGALRIGYTVTWPLEKWLPVLNATIQSCPNEWLWIFRTHPSDSSGRLQLMELKAELPQHRIELDKGQDVSVVEFLSNVDVHATHHSTCALEALALGKPTLITDATSSESFHHWIDAGVMLIAEHPENFADAVAQALRIESSRVVDISRSLFATDGDFRHSIEELARDLGSKSDLGRSCSP